MEAEWPAWRLITAEQATLAELSGPNATYTLYDIYKHNAVLDMQSDFEAYRRKKQGDK